MTNQERIAIARKAISEALGVNIDTYCNDVVGSTYIRDNSASDVDILVLVPNVRLEEEHFDGWAYGGSVGMGNDHWMSWKRTVDGVEVNMLLVGNRQYYDDWLTAAEVCRFLHLQGYAVNTGTVHGIHEIIMDDSTADAEVRHRNY